MEIQEEQPTKTTIINEKQQEAEEEKTVDQKEEFKKFMQLMQEKAQNLKDLGLARPGPSMRNVNKDLKKYHKLADAYPEDKDNEQTDFAAESFSSEQIIDRIKGSRKKPKDANLSNGFVLAGMAIATIGVGILIYYRYFKEEEQVLQDPL